MPAGKWVDTGKNIFGAIPKISRGEVFTVLTNEDHKVHAARRKELAAGARPLIEQALDAMTDVRALGNGGGDHEEHLSPPLAAAAHNKPAERQGDALTAAKEPLHLTPTEKTHRSRERHNP